MHISRSAIVSTIVVAIAVGCSGPGTTPPEATIPTAPVLTLTVTGPTTLEFAWADVAGETEYRLRESPTGTAPYATIATLAAGTTDHGIDVFLPAQRGALYTLQACNAAGCATSQPVTPGGEGVIDYVKASDAAAGDSFGFRTSLSGDGATLAVGAFGRQNETGAVYVFVRDGDSWVEQAQLFAANAGAGDRFGWWTALSADGDTLAVGAVFESGSATGIDGDDDDLAPAAGAAYVFVRDGEGAWTQQAYVKPSNTAPAGWFGASLTLSADGNTLAVGSNGRDAGTGAAYVFSRTGTLWAEDAFVTASNPTAGDWFGQNVMLSRDGQTLGVSSTRQDDGAADSGAVYVFVRDDASWSEQTMLKASNPGVFALFGISIAFSADGDVLAIGARYEDGGATGVDGDQSDTSATDAGAVYVFERTGASWSQQAYVKASNTAPNGQFGIGVSLTANGAMLAVAALGDASGAVGFQGDQDDDSAPMSGAAYVFTRRGGGPWSQTAYLKATNTDANDGLISVALSDDGSVLAAAAPDEAGNGLDPSDDSMPGAGAVYVYR